MNFNFTKYDFPRSFAILANLGTAGAATRVRADIVACCRAGELADISENILALEKF